MEIGNRNKWQLRMAVVAIFTLGVVAGALSWNLYREWRVERPLEGRRERFEHLLNRLNLTPEQRPQVEKILDEARAQFIEVRKQSEPRMQEVRQQTDQRLQTVLTTQQWEQFKQMRDEMRSRYGRGRGGREDIR